MRNAILPAKRTPQRVWKSVRKDWIFYVFTIYYIEFLFWFYIFWTLSKFSQTVNLLFFDAILYLPILFDKKYNMWYNYNRIIMCI